MDINIELLDKITLYGHLFLLFVCFMIVFFHSVLGGNSDKYHNLCKKTFKFDDGNSVYGFPWLLLFIFGALGTACALGGVIPYLICGITIVMLAVMFGGLVLLAKYISKRID